jgi:hypothetical protein
VLQQAPPAFDDAIAAIDAAGVIPDIRDWGEMITENAQDAKEYGKLKGDPLSADGIAYVMGYSDEATTPPLYADMNNKSYDKDRSLFTPYSQYMVGLVKHMKGIEVYPNHQVFRGVKADLRDQYPQGRKVTWHGFCSTTKSAKVLENPLFCGEVGKRTIFAIQLTQGQAREISRYSLVQSEDEILLPPGCKFEVQSVLPQGDLTIIQLLEVASKDWVFDLSSPAAAPAPTPAPTPAPAPAPAPAPGMFQFGDLLKELGAPVPARMYVYRDPECKGATYRIRRGPGFEHQEVAGLQVGDEFTAGAEQGGWLEVLDSRNQHRGWSVKSIDGTQYLFAI